MHSIGGRPANSLRTSALYLISFQAMFAKSVDAVKVLAAAIKKCGEEPDAVSRCLTETKDYHGASGSISFDANGDGVRSYVLKKVSKGILHELELKEPNA